MWFNVLIIVLSIVFSFGTWFILGGDSECPSLRIILYATIVLNIINIVIAILNLTGNETKVCTGNFICTVAIIEVVMMIWMQVRYFNS